MKSWGKMWGLIITNKEFRDLEQAVHDEDDAKKKKEPHDV